MMGRPGSVHRFYLDQRMHNFKIEVMNFLIDWVVIDI